MSHHRLEHVFAGYKLEVFSCYVDTGQVDECQPGLICRKVLRMDGPDKGLGATVGGVFLKGEHEGAELGAGKANFHHGVVGSCQSTEIGGTHSDHEGCEPICGSNLKDGSRWSRVDVAITHCMHTPSVTWGAKHAVEC